MSFVQIFEDVGKCKNKLMQQNIGKKIVLAKNSKTSVAVKADLSVAGRLVALEKNMVSINEEIDALFILKNPLQQHGRKQLFFLVTCANVVNEGMLEMSCSIQGNDTSVEKNLEVESHEEVLDKMQVLEETKVSEETQVS